LSEIHDKNLNKAADPKKDESKDLQVNTYNSEKATPYSVNSNSATNVTASSNGSAVITPPSYHNNGQSEEEKKEEGTNDSKKNSSGADGSNPNDSSDDNSNPDDNSDVNDSPVEIKDKQEEGNNEEEIKDSGKKEAEKTKDKSAEESNSEEGKKAEEESKESEEKEQEKEKKGQEGEAEGVKKAEEGAKKATGNNASAKKSASGEMKAKVKETSGQITKMVKESNTTTIDPKKPQIPSSSQEENGPDVTYGMKQENSSEFSGDIVKTSPSGNVVVAPSSPIQNPEEKGATPLPKEIEEKENAKIQEQNSKAVEGFAANNNGKINSIKQQGGSLITQVGVSISQAVSVVDGAKASALNQLDQEIAAATSSATTAFDGAIAAVNAKHTGTLTRLNASAQKALADLDAAKTASIAEATTLQETLTTTANEQIDLATQHMTEGAQTKGAQAIETANAQAAVEAAVPLEEQGFWSDLANGGDYPKNKRKARVEACKTVGTKMNEEFTKEASNAVAAMVENKASAAEMIASKIAEIKASLEQQTEAKKAEINSSLQQSISSADSVKNSQVEALTNAKTTQLDNLANLKDSKAAEISQTAGQEKAQITQLGNSSKQQLQSTLNQGLQALQTTNQQSIVQLKSQERIKTDAFQGILDNVGSTFASQADEFSTSLQTSASDTNSTLSSSANSAQQTIQGVMSATTQAINSTTAQIKQQVSGMQSSAEQQLDDVAKGGEDADKALVEGTKTSFSEQITGLSEQLSQAIVGMGADMMKSATELTDGFQSELDGIHKTMSESAQKAEDAVQPRWKKFLKIFVEVLFVIALAVIVAALATVLGPIALIFAAIAVGAALGVAKQMINNAIDGKPIMEGTLKAAVIGGIEGLFAAVGAGALGKIMSKGGSALASRGINLATKVPAMLKGPAAKAIGKFAGQLASNVGEGVSKQIATNIMDGKDWKKDLWKATSGAVIDTVMGAGTAKATGKIKGSELLGDAVGDSLKKKAARKTAEIAVDYAGSTLGDGVKKVAENADKIMEAGSFTEGLSLAGSSFAEGATTDMDGRLLKTGLTSLKDPAVNKTKDAIGEYRANQQGLGPAPEGYSYNVGNEGSLFKNSGQMDLRQTATLDKSGNVLKDLSLDSGNNVINRGSNAAEMDGITNKKEFDNVFDPDGLLSRSVKGEALNYIRQGRRDKAQDLLSQHQNTIDASRAPTKLAQEMGLGDPPPGYKYAMKYDPATDSQVLDLRRTATKNADGKVLPDLTIDASGKIKREVDNFPEQDQITSLKQFKDEYDPDGKLGSDITGMAYNYLRQGKKAEFEQLMAANDPAVSAQQRMNSLYTKSEQAATAQGLPAAPKGYHYSTSASGTLYIKRTSKTDDDGNTLPQLKIEGNSLVPSKTLTETAPEGGLPDAEARGFKPGVDPDYIASLPKGYRPAVEEYMTPTFIQEHLEKFDTQGGAFLVVKPWIEGGSYQNFPSRKFVMLKEDMDSAIEAYRLSGDVKTLEKALGYNDGDLAGLESELYVFYPNSSQYNFAVADGNEIGANNLWEAGAETSGGNREAVLEGLTDPNETIKHDNDIEVLKDQFDYEKL